MEQAPQVYGSGISSPAPATTDRRHISDERDSHIDGPLSSITFGCSSSQAQRAPLDTSYAESALISTSQPCFRALSHSVYDLGGLLQRVNPHDMRRGVHVDIDTELVI